MVRAPTALPNKSSVLQVALHRRMNFRCTGGASHEVAGLSTSLSASGGCHIKRYLEQPERFPARWRAATHMEDVWAVAHNNGTSILSRQ